MKTLEDFAFGESTGTHTPGHEATQTRAAAKPESGFVIQEIEMKGFMRYVEKTVPPLSFPNKLTVITGKTGSGKTSILDAVTFALYKKTSRTDIQSVKISDICRPGGYVKVSFIQNSEEYEVKRGFTSSSSPYLTLKSGARNIEGNIKELEKTIEEVIGLDYDGFRNSTFVRQEEMKGLGAERGADRLVIFQKLFRLETFKKAEILVSKRLDRIKNNIRSLETELKIRNEQMSKLPVLEEEFQKKSQFVQAEKKKLEELKQAIGNLAQELEILAKKHDEFVSLRDSIDSLEERIRKTSEKHTLALAEEKKVEPLKMRIAYLEKDTKEYEAILSEGEQLKESQRRYLTLKRDIDRERVHKDSLIKQRDSEMKKLSERIFRSENRIAKLSTTMGKDEAFNMLRKEGSLSERVERIGKETQWLKDNDMLVKELRAERSEAECELEDLKKKTKDINEDSFVLSEIEAGIEQTRKDKSELDENYTKKVGTIETKIMVDERNLTKLGFGEVERQRLTEIRSTVSEMRTKKEELEEKSKKLNEIGDMTSLISHLQSRKKGMEKERESLSDRFSALKDEEQKYQKTRQSIDLMRNKKEALHKDIFGTEGEIKRLTQGIAELKNLKLRMMETEKNLAEFRSQGEISHILRDKVFHRRGIVMYAIDQLLPQLSLETSANLSDMTDGRFSKVRLASYEENNRYGIRIEVSGPDGQWHDVQEFSGGEKTQINAALRFAIAQELASIPQVGRTYGRMKTLFIDEGDLGSLDTEVSRQLFVNKLFSMGKFFEKIILITHLTEVAEQFPGRIMVYMTPEQESRIEVLA